MESKIRIEALRKEMLRHQIDWYLVPTTDFHGSEYVADYFKARAFLSGFTGSAGTLLVGLNEAFLWTDGRYFIQAESQLSGTSITLMKSGEPGIPSLLDFLRAKASRENFTLGFDGRVISCKEYEEFESLGITLISGCDLIDLIWTDRPPLSAHAIYALPPSSVGRTTDEKLADVRTEMRGEECDFVLMTALEEIAWLLNLRGCDIRYTPVFYAFALIAEKEITLYLDASMLPEGFRDANPSIHVRPYQAIWEDLSTLPRGDKIWFDDTLASVSLIHALPDDVSQHRAPSPVDILKAVKNDVEIRATRNAHYKDGIAMVNFLYWLKHFSWSTPLTELDVAEHLLTCRKRQDDFLDLSFETIAGYNENGAIIHYAPTPDSNATLSPEGLLLLDSGAHYRDGTTDITRTIALGPLSEKMRLCYTLVLRAHIALATAVFTTSTLDRDLDQITRKPLLAKGYDFNHGTGHGVGHILSVHEGPQWISPRGNSRMYPGMITSNEPGVYLEGEFGIRLENEMLCVKKGENLAFETITLCPFDREAIDVSLLSKEEKRWINDYHRLVYERLAPSITEEVRDWLACACAEL